jgi:hypothetical protein
MNLPFSLPVQEFIRASERLSEFVANHKGLHEDDCKAVLFYTHELSREIEQHCMERHHDIYKRVA